MDNTRVPRPIVDSVLLAVDKQGEKDRVQTSHVFLEFERRRTTAFATTGTVLFAAWTDFDQDVTHFLAGQKIGLHFSVVDLVLKGGKELPLELRKREEDPESKIELRCGSRWVVADFTTQVPDWRGLVPAQPSRESAYYMPFQVGRLQQCFNVLRGLKNTNQTNPVFVVQNGTSPGIAYEPNLDALGLVMPFKADPQHIQDVEAGVSEHVSAFLHPEWPEAQAEEEKPLDPPSLPDLTDEEIAAAFEEAHQHEDSDDALIEGEGGEPEPTSETTGEDAPEPTEEAAEATEEAPEATAEANAPTEEAPSADAESVVDYPVYDNPLDADVTEPARTTADDEPTPETAEDPATTAEEAAEATEEAAEASEEAAEATSGRSKRRRSKRGRRGAAIAAE